MARYISPVRHDPTFLSALSFFISLLSRFEIEIWFLAFALPLVEISRPCLGVTAAPCIAPHTQTHSIVDPTHTHKLHLRLIGFGLPHLMAPAPAVHESGQGVWNPEGKSYLDGTCQSKRNIPKIPDRKGKRKNSPFYHYFHQDHPAFSKQISQN